jgi:putative PIN family toxin of toxin-antitoxin system
MTLHEPRYVFDTNVLISALLFPMSTPGQAFVYAHEHGKILVSAPLLGELQHVLGRPKFEAYVTPTERNQFLTALVHDATLVTITVELHVARDPKDNIILELAVSGAATTIVTGDPDLLALRVYDSISIQTPAAFLHLE